MGDIYMLTVPNNLGLIIDGNIRCNFYKKNLLMSTFEGKKCSHGHDGGRQKKIGLKDIPLQFGISHR